MNKLRLLRRVMAALMLVAATLLFVDVSGLAHGPLAWVAHIQFLPAILAGSIAVVVAIVVLTLLFGRIYCSVVCPLGILQDVVAHLGLKARKRRYGYSPEKRWLRIVVFVLFVIALVAGSGGVAMLIAPYATFGRIAQNLFQPIYQGLNNLLAMASEAADDYTFSSADVWIRSIPLFIVSALSFIIIAILAWRNGRTYCNTICPVGTVLGFLSRFSLFAVTIDESKCVGCGLCAKSCKAACINAKGDVDCAHKIDKSRCVACFNCIDNCHTGAISYKFRLLHQASDSSVEDEKPLADDGKRSFLTGVGLVVASAAIGQDHVADGGLAPIEDKVSPRRAVPLVPPGAISLRNFSRHCVGCQLCVAQCPNGVLRPSDDGLLSFSQPRMSYERGYCRPECNTCSTVCPAGAIRPISLDVKSSTVIGHAVWVADLCIVNRDGVSCGNCARHCPNGAIAMVSFNGDKSKLIPVVNDDLCIGCGACEHVCPSRPLSAIYVEGHENHKTN